MNIFVGNIAFIASEADLRNFEQHGTVDKHLITDRYKGAHAFRSWNAKCR
jgi:hypothetical protein